MCGLCNDLDSYESRHGHRCDDSCLRGCDVCGEYGCELDGMVRYMKDENGEINICVKCERTAQ